MALKSHDNLPNRPWLRYGLLALGIIALIELPFVVLALNSVIPYQLVASHQYGTTIICYWDGHIESFPYVQLPWLATVLWWSLPTLTAGWIALWAYLAWRCWPNGLCHKQHVRFSIRSMLWAVAWAGICLLVVTLIEPEEPPWMRLLQAGVMFWMIGCLFVLRGWRKRYRS